MEPPLNRKTALLAVLESWLPDPQLDSPPLTLNADHLLASSIEAVYAIPRDLIGILDRHIPTWWQEDEKDVELQFARRCEGLNAQGVFRANFVRHPFLGPRASRVIPEKWFPAETWKGQTHTVLCRALREDAQLTDIVHERRQAYAGWLVTYPAYIKECDCLRRKWNDRLLGGMDCPPFPDKRVLGYLVAVGRLAAPGPELQMMTEELAAFYKRWDLLRLATWDLPEPTMGNFGGPSDVGQLAGVGDSPAVQLPQTLRLPDRLRVDRFLRTKPDDHLAEWRSIENRDRPGGQHYARLARTFQFHFLRNVVLKGAYGNRFGRRLEALDEAFAEYFGDVGDESIRRQRLWVDGRLRSAPPLRNR